MSAKVKVKSVHPSASLVRVLLIDDDPDIRNIVRHFLEKDNVIVVEAQDGAAGLQTLANEPFDLLIIDLLMPQMDGFTVLQELNKPETPGAWRNGVRIPVVVLSSMSQEHNRARVMELGAVDFVSKPLDMKKLQEVVGRSIHSGSGFRGVRI